MTVALAGREKQGCVLRGLPMAQQLHQCSRGLDLHLVHQTPAMNLDGLFGGSERAGDLLVQQAARHELEDLVFTRRQRAQQFVHALPLGEVHTGFGVFGQCFAKRHDQRCA